MRELKFRAWCKDWIPIYGSGMSYGEVEHFDDMIGFRFHHTETTPFEKITLEQYTGLKDKNGKEIFEGDVVKYKIGYKVSEPSDEPQNVCSSTGVVAFKDGEFLPRPHGFYPEDYWYGYKYFDFEVIGNIHENPELLK